MKRKRENDGGSNSEEPEGLGDVLKKYRKRADLTQEALAQLSTVSKRDISDIERGKIRGPREDTLQLLTNSLKLSSLERANLERLAAAGRSRGVRQEPELDIETEVVASLEGRTEEQDQSSPNDASTIPLDQLGKFEQINEAETTEPDKEAVSIIISKAHLLVGVAGVVLLTVVALLVERTFSPIQPTPAGTALPSWGQGNIALGIVGGWKGLHFSGMSTADDGRLFTEPGRVVTMSFTIRNSEHAGGKTAKLKTVVASVHGPDACAYGWRAEGADFEWASEEIILRPGDEYNYVRANSFKDKEPGVYFVEPLLQDSNNNSWHGIGPFPRIYFSVVGPKTKQLPPPDCITPVPTFKLTRTTIDSQFTPLIILLTTP